MDGYKGRYTFFEGYRVAFGFLSGKDNPCTMTEADAKELEIRRAMDAYAFDETDPEFQSDELKLAWTLIISTLSKSVNQAKSGRAAKERQEANKTQTGYPNRVPKLGVPSEVEEEIETEKEKKPRTRKKKWTTKDTIAICECGGKITRASQSKNFICRDCYTSWTPEEITRLTGIEV